MVELGGFEPFDYARDVPQAPIVPVPVEADAVRNAFTRYAAGDVSMAELADGFNAAGLRPRSK